MILVESWKKYLTELESVQGLESSFQMKASLQPDFWKENDLLDSGIFTEEEVTRILWSDFEENYRVMRNPEKYKDPDESDKPYHKRSKEARMRDPERGINSPAFKKFMADRGM